MRSDEQEFIPSHFYFLTLISVPLNILSQEEAAESITVVTDTVPLSRAVVEKVKKETERDCPGHYTAR